MDSLWKTLEVHALSMPNKSDPSTINPTHAKHAFHASACNIHLDFSNQHITPEILTLLIKLAHSRELHNKIDALMSGRIVNFSENKPALHTALRVSNNTPLWVNHRNIMEDILATRKQMERMVESIRENRWLGFSGKPITDIVNIGIGGSDLGPRFAINALSDYTSHAFGYYFISDADPYAFQHTVAHLNPETTLFIISSKSFTTQETLYNAKKAQAWIGPKHDQKNHFIAVTANPTKALEFGITQILPIWDWVGGRYSFCSAINLITAIAIGFESFTQILSGAEAMDQHFRNSDFAINLPVLLGLLGIWNNNFLHIHQLLILTYAQRLEQFVPYVQQLDMESNGKSIDNQGQAVAYATGPIVWGGLGNQAQHSYYQLLCQGTHRIAADFISLKAYSGQMINHMCNNKINVLTQGVHYENNSIPGNTPINHIQISDLTPYTIGALIALYEHKIYTQSVIWNINPFDQPGVESSKRNFVESRSVKQSVV